MQSPRRALAIRSHLIVTDCVSVGTEKGDVIYFLSYDLLICRGERSTRVDDDSGGC